MAKSAKNHPWKFMPLTAVDLETRDKVSTWGEVLIIKSSGILYQNHAPSFGLLSGSATGFDVFWIIFIDININSSPAYLSVTTGIRNYTTQIYIEMTWFQFNSVYKSTTKFYDAA